MNELYIWNVYFIHTSLHYTLARVSILLYLE